MKQVPLGSTGRQVPAIVLGMMRTGEMSDAALRELVGTARDHGIDFFDHAAVYGPGLHGAEARFGDALRLSSSEREQVILQTKAGIVGGKAGYDSSYDHITQSAEASLKALRTDYLDILLIHRPDALVEPDEVARAFDDLEAAGKVRHFGVSNHTAAQMDLLRTAVRQPLVANQLQLSLTHAPIVAQGVAANMQGEPQATVLDGGGLLDQCRLQQVTVQAWSPFQAGFFTGPFIGSDDYRELNEVLDRLAQRYDVTADGIAVAWITRHPAAMQVVLGTTRPDRVVAAAAGADVPLTRAEWYELFSAAGHRIP